MQPLKRSKWRIQLTVLLFLLMWQQKQYALGFYAQPEAIHFAVSPVDVLTCEGCGQITLTCGILRQRTAANVPEPDLQWLLNDGMISPGAQIEVFKNDSTSMLISHLIISIPQSAQSGRYRCAATDGDKHPLCGDGKLPCVPTVTLSNEASVQIISNTDTIQHINASACSTKLLACQPNHVERFITGNLYPLEWRKNGKSINSTSEQFIQLPNGNLVLSNLGGVNVGLYECLTRFYNGSDVVTDVTVSRYTVNAIEDISALTEQHNKLVEVLSSQAAYFEGETLSLVCVFDLQSENDSNCLKTAKTTWSINSTMIRNTTTSGINLEDSILTLHSTFVEDSGNYCCSIEVNNETHSDCIVIEVFPQANPSLPMNGSPTVFVKKTTNNRLQINSFYPSPSQLVWYYNGIELNEQRGNGSLVLSSDDRDLCGMYQCFLSVYGFPQILLNGTRVMPHDRINPPGPTEYKEVVRATSDTSRVPIQVSWQPPFYTGNLAQIGFQLYGGEMLNFTLDHSVVLLFTLYLPYSVNVEVRDPTNKLVRVSDRSVSINTGQQGTLEPNCDPFFYNQVLYPPSLSLSCENSFVSLIVADNTSNTYQDESRLYYVRGSCTGGNETEYINQKLTTTNTQLEQSFKLGTHCTLQAAASTEDFSTCTWECGCWDPDLIEYSQHSHCSVTAELIIMPTNQTVVESNTSVQVCVTISTFVVLETEMMLTLETRSATAIGGYDFDEFQAHIYLNETTRTACMNVTVIDDDALEGREYLVVEVSNNDPDVHIINGLAHIHILDNDSVNVSLIQAVYSVSEGDILMLCIEMFGQLEKTNITTSIESRNGTAKEGADYKRLHAEIHLTETANVACVNVTILEDELLEETESFFVFLRTDDPDVNIVQRYAEVLILDNDEPSYIGAVIGTLSGALLFLTVVCVLCVVWKFCGNRNTYTLKQMKEFRMKDKRDGLNHFDDPVCVDPDPSCSSMEADDESVYELYYSECRQTATINVEHPNHSLDLCKTLDKHQLEKETVEYLRELHDNVLSTEANTPDGIRKISDSSGFSDDSHYVRYPLNYSIKHSRYLSEHPNYSSQNHGQLKTLVTGSHVHYNETDV